jgi:hypothetical protein
MAAELGPFIQEEHAMVSQRYLARLRHLPSPISPVAEMVWWGALQGPGRDPRRAVAGKADDAVDTRRLNGLGEGHRRQDGGEAAGQHRLARPRGAEQEYIMVGTPHRLQLHVHRWG